MIYDLKLLVKLKIPDVTAVTAKNTLQRRMGYKDILRDLRREDYWKIKVEAKSEKEARRLGVELAEKANIFVNPNKHTYRLEVGGQKSEDRRQRLREDKLYPVRVLVSYLEDGTAHLICDALKNRLRYGKKVLEVQRGTIWTLIIRAENEEVARQIAQEITLTKDRKRGLLMNPHFQKYKIYI